uniref:Homeobox domain-containing protein n=1 Tax=Palpitomonas bilix TaxID=652834 RepID=A0A7S3DG43_9EUKA|mmetsp:Transcript_36182/g.94107  ORF Transcript_36182/g.94107 Transcript_36182/m.94107 type:complete len:260 (+) Transcript_36182:77-856(+)|eukprot:CAMPEP_0113870420 /NCGR_PEP_ID=MMETSP0780_2-20120614/2073_1 /TAXON_ID=652834 /ORGANISM="Palpitomonas bilix" /LENGTH=259 /DNA_ID=CAMNT_0000855689 /DNA_START=87 /DNA_END=866 /DNA_ORIENTATION=+ /assembly_acc=CAM_ASM_000599
MSDKAPQGSEEVPTGQNASQFRSAREVFDRHGVADGGLAEWAKFFLPLPLMGLLPAMSPNGQRVGQQTSVLPNPLLAAFVQQQRGFLNHLRLPQHDMLKPAVKATEKKRGGINVKYTEAQVVILVQHFLKNPKPSGKEVSEIVEEAHPITREQVVHWFQNHRARYINRPGRSINEKLDKMLCSGELSSVNFLALRKPCVEKCSCGCCISDKNGCLSVDVQKVVAGGSIHKPTCESNEARGKRPLDSPEEVTGVKKGKQL